MSPVVLLALACAQMLLTARLIWFALETRCTPVDVAHLWRRFGFSDATATRWLGSAWLLSVAVSLMLWVRAALESSGSVTVPVVLGAGFVPVAIVLTLMAERGSPSRLFPPVWREALSRAS